MAATIDLLISGGTVVPMEKDRQWFRGDVLVREGMIREITRGPAPAERASEAAVVLDASDALVLPGLVQGHVHVVQTLLRHQADNLELLDWLRLRTWPYEAALDGDGVAAAAQLGVAELLCGGTTTALDFGTTHDHDRVFEAAERLGIRLFSGKAHMDLGDEVPAGLLEDRESSLADAARLGSRWHGAANGRLGYAVAPRFALSCSPELLGECSRLARENGWLLQTHAAENRDEVEAVRRLTGADTIGYLDSVGLSGPGVVLAHCVHLSRPETDLLARTATRVCHCPGANLKLGSGIADLPGLLRAGIKVTLGADGAPCNNRLSVFHEMSLAATLHLVRHGARAIDAWTVLAMATREGARALGLEDEIGTITVGKKADITIVSTADWAMIPDGDPASRLVHGATASSVRHVVVDGRPVVVGSHLQTAPEAEIRDQARAAWAATRARMGEIP